MHIERGSAERLEDLVRLNAVAQNLHVNEEPKCFLPYNKAAVCVFLRGALTDAAVTFLIALEGPQAVGYAMLRVCDKPGTPFSFTRRFLEIEHIAVDPQFTGRGIGGALIDEAAAVAQGLGISDMELSVWEFNEEARRLFRRKGFRPFTQRMRRG